MLDKISAHCSSNHYCNLVRNTISENPGTVIITTTAAFLALSGIAIFCYNSHTPQSTLRDRDVENFTDAIERAQIEALKKELNVIKDQHGRITEKDIIKDASNIDPTSIQQAANTAIENNTSLTFGKEDSNSVLDFLKLDFPCFVELLWNKKDGKAFFFNSAIGAILAPKFDYYVEFSIAFKDVNEKSGLEIVEKYKSKKLEDWSNYKIILLKAALRSKFAEVIFANALLSTKNAHLKFVGTSADFPNNEIGEVLMEIRGKLATKIMNDDKDSHGLKSIAKVAKGIVPDPAK